MGQWTKSENPSGMAQTTPSRWMMRVRFNRNRHRCSAMMGGLPCCGCDPCGGESLGVWLGMRPCPLSRVEQRCHVWLNGKYPLPRHISALSQGCSPSRISLPWFGLGRHPNCFCHPPAVVSGHVLCRTIRPAHRSVATPHRGTETSRSTTSSEWTCGLREVSALCREERLVSVGRSCQPSLRWRPGS